MNTNVCVVCHCDKGKNLRYCSDSCKKINRNKVANELWAKEKKEKKMCIISPFFNGLYTPLRKED